MGRSLILRSVDPNDRVRISARRRFAEQMVHGVAQRAIELVVEALDVNALLARTDLNAVLVRVELNDLLGRVVYQAGFLQGRYGFGRVALLAEEGTEPFSNIAGIVRLDFPAPQVDSTFIDLQRMLQREGLMRHRKRQDV